MKQPTIIPALAAFAISTASCCLGESAFDDGFLNSGYWTDGRAEFNIYGGSVARYGTPREGTRALHILVRESFSPDALVKADDWREKGAYPVLKLNQSYDVPTGVYIYRQMLSTFWKLPAGDLVKASLTSNDSCGNTFKLIERDRNGGLNYRWDTYWQGMVKGEEPIDRPEGGIFYDELPLMVRLIDFDKGPLEFEAPLAPTLITSKKGELAFKPARFTVVSNEADELATVTVDHADGRDIFRVQRAEPRLLVLWQRSDGGVLNLEHSLKIDYWNYNKQGDLEKALGNPEFVQYP